MTTKLSSDGFDGLNVGKNLIFIIFIVALLFYINNELKIIFIAAVLQTGYHDFGSAKAVSSPLEQL